MTETRSWLDSRTPSPPGDLRVGVEAALSEAAGPGGTAGGSSPTPWPRALDSAAVGRLEQALARPGRVRDSAFELLVADALATYASEAALEEEDADAALVRLATALDAAGGS